MLSGDDIREMDEEEIQLFVRELETISDITKTIDFARALEANALDELEFREDNFSPEAVSK